MDSFTFQVSDCYLHFGIIREIDEEELLIASVERTAGTYFDLQNISISSAKAKLSNSEINARSHTSPVKITQEDRERNTRSMHKRGIAAEKALAIKWAADLLKQNLKEASDKARETMGYLNSNILADYCDKIAAVTELKELALLLQVSESLGDGLGYDVLEPVITNGQLSHFNKVEVKSSKGNYQIHFSRNELEKILAFHDSKDWKLLHFVDGKCLDRTQVIKSAVKEDFNVTVMPKRHLQAESWVIDFKDES
jgi:hypothetical protein